MPTIFDVHAEFERRLSGSGRVVLAGGAIRDHLMGKEPKDFDVFVLATTGPEGVAETLADLEPVILLDFHKSEPFLVATVRWNGVMVQVMTNPAPTVAALIDTFDWNVCLFAFDGSFHQREQIENIGHGKELRLQTVTFPTSTLRRGFRFSERFSMILKREDIVRLCREVTKADDNRLAATVAVE